MDTEFEGMVLFLALAALTPLAIYLWLKTRAVRRRLEELSAETAQLSSLVAKLTRRVYELEQRTGAEPEPPTPIAVAAADIRVGAVDLPQLPVDSAARPTPSPTPPSDKDPSQPEDWESVVGTSWLNRFGALILVVGIALFLAYSLTHLGPAGKVAIGFSTGLSLLASGVLIERKEAYRNFALGLIGAGWAITYFTAYALHAIPAARIVENPVAGLIGLLAVSGAMIAHSLRFKSEVATGLAFIFAFASLNLTTATQFGLLALAVLSGAVLAVSLKFGWTRLSVAGVALTYLSALIRGSAPYGQAYLWLYWLLFETFDLLGIRRNGERQGVARFAFFLNAAGFLAATSRQNWYLPLIHWERILFIASAAYFASTLIRGKLLKQESRGFFAGSYHAAAALSALLMAGALIAQFEGLMMPLALLIEGELIVLAGFFLASRFVRGLGSVVLAIAFIRFLFVDIGDIDLKLNGGVVPGLVSFAGLRFHHWSPLALLMAAVFAGNRLLLRGGIFYAAGASILIAAIIHADFDRFWAAAAWSALAFVVLVIGVRFDKIDLRVQAYVAFFICAFRAAILLESSGNEPLGSAIAVFTAGLLYAGQWLTRRANLRSGERLQHAYLSVLGTLLVTCIIFDAVQGRLLTVALACQAAVLLVVGFTAAERVLRLSGLLLFLFCTGKLFLHDLSELDTLSRILSFVVLGLMMIAASWVYTRYREKVRKLL